MVGDTRKEMGREPEFQPELRAGIMLGRSSGGKNCGNFGIQWDMGIMNARDMDTTM